MITDRRKTLARLVAGLSCISAIAAAAPSLYLALLTVLAPVAARGRPPKRAESTRFAVCVPAHDEAAVIGATVRALVDQQYPAEFAIHVVADNCSDGTAKAAADAGAIVHERVEPGNRGKGAALNWLTDQLSSSEFDALVVIDADTIADPGLLTAIDRAFGAGASVVQGYYGVRDPGSSPTVGLRFAAIACRHHLRPLARNAIGASCGLYGNGMAFRSDIIAARRWSNHLIEDAEFQLELLLDGHTVTYVPDAVLLAEMPDTFDGAASQNERWELGRLQLARHYLLRLIRRVVTRGPLPRHVYVDAIADLVSPPLSVQATLDIGAVSLATVSFMARPTSRSRFQLIVGLMSSVVLAIHVLVALRLVNAPGDVYRSLRSAPRAAIWKLMLLARISRRPTEVTWTRTTRNTENPRTA